MMTEEVERVSNRGGLTRGGKNLVWLGLLAIAVALVTTSVSLMIYHNSGDIYLDRSRPGFLPDEAESQEDKDIVEEYVFAKSGKLTIVELSEYLEKLQLEVEAIEMYQNPFSAEALSDEALGI